MNSKEVTFVSFERLNDSFKASFAVEDFLRLSNAEKLAQKAEILYKDQVREMLLILKTIESFRAGRNPVLARDVWKIGNAVFRLRAKMSMLSLEVNDLYSHLVRDLGVKRKWLEKAVILRRYIAKPDLIPENSSWGQFEKGTRRKSELLVRGNSLESKKQGS